MEIYSWDDNQNSLLLIDWRVEQEHLSFDGFGGCAPTLQYPYVVNGQYRMEGVQNTGVIALGDRKASFLCVAPKGANYNDILNQVRQKHENLFSCRLSSW